MKKGFTRRLFFCWFPLLVVSLINAGPAQVLEHKKPTEQLIKRYEKLVAEGALLSPEGWARASRLFEQSSPYPADSEIDIRSGPGLIGEVNLSGEHAEVGTKWGDYYGKLDSHLRFKGTGYGDSIMYGGSYSLVFVPQGPSATAAGTASTSRQWKIEGAPRLRAADIPATIKYVQMKRDKSNDPAVRKNAERTITILKRLTPGCGNASAC